MSELKDFGPFVASPDGRVVYGSGDGADVMLDIDGNWENDEQRQEFARMVADALNGGEA